MARCKIVPNPPLSIICRRGKRSLWRLIKYFAKAGEPRERAGSPAAACPLPGSARHGSAGLSGSQTPGVLRAGALGIASPPAPQKRGGFPRCPAGRMARAGGPPPRSPPAVGARRRKGGGAAPSSFSVAPPNSQISFGSVLWFAGDKACLQTAAGELPRRGEEARLCQRRTKPPNSSKLFLGVLGRRKKKIK